MRRMRQIRLNGIAPALILHSADAESRLTRTPGPACIIRIHLENTMAKTVSLTRHSRRSVLNRRETLVLENAQGTIIAVDRGCLWVTLERDLRDIVLVKGMRFQIDRSGRTIIAAEADSTLRLLAPETSRDRVVAAIGRAVAQALNGWAGRLAQRAVPYF
ncbi:MAG: DUF2917 domain-containing protein [Betaproteobacteria bacterium]|nr:MAG: DUF2917 domain-containing protein [Betaproteobacteria bacterium]TMH46534.1 MAG: DUF2917 domain-containing protein [Betaproteobacteria bacterium]